MSNKPKAIESAGLGKFSREKEEEKRERAEKVEVKVRADQVRHIKIGGKYRRVTPYFRM